MRRRKRPAAAVSFCSPIVTATAAPTRRPPVSPNQTLSARGCVAFPPERAQPDAGSHRFGTVEGGGEGGISDDRNGRLLFVVPRSFFILLPHLSDWEETALHRCFFARPPSQLTYLRSIGVARARSPLLMRPNTKRQQTDSVALT